MSAFLISILISLAVQLLKYGISTVYEARKLRRPNIRDKEGTRAWLENLLRWAAYLQQTFFSDLATPALTLAVLLELVKPGEKWDALYEAILHDFNVSRDLAPRRLPEPEMERERKVRSFCRALKERIRMNQAPGDPLGDDVSSTERAEAEEYLALFRRLLDHPGVFNQAQKTWHIISRPSHQTRNHS